MNKAELKAITTIAKKMNWQNKPVCEIIETINQMVRNQQALELDTVGECDDYEDTLLSIALWETDKIVSTMYVYDYVSLHEWYWNIICEDFGITSEDFHSMLEFYEVSQNYLAECYEAEEETEWLNSLTYQQFNEAVCNGWL